MKLYKHTLLLFTLFIWSTSILYAAPTKIMLLGDSITYDSRYGDTRPTSTREAYRSHLWYMLQDAKYNADFVGSQKAGSTITPPFDIDNEGHPGWSSYQIAERVYGYMLNSQPDIVLLHIGTNDHSTSTRGVESILNEIDQYERDTNHKVTVLVALIIDREVHDPIIAAFNKKLSSLISFRRQTGDIVTLVDMYNKSALAPADYADNTHPNSTGYKKMANVWLDALLSPYKPFNTALGAFSYTLVGSEDIISIDINEAENTVEFETEIPNDGIRF